MIAKMTETQALGNTLLKEHGLTEQGWKFCLDSSKQRVGECRFDEKEIGVSLYYLERSTKAEILDTILHEIAHALLGSGHGHDMEWKLMCLRIGAKPERLAGEEAVSSAKPNYRIKCNNCGWFTDRFRMRRRNYGSRCPRCHTEVKIYRITYKPKGGK